MNKEEIFDSVEECIADFAEGKIVIVADDEGRENEGDMICAGEKVTPEIINTMVRYARGLVCVPTTSERLLELGIDDMVRLNRDAKGTAFTVTVDASQGITTGISAADRALTINLLANPKATASDFVSPGHLCPLRARNGGVLERAGHTEAAVDMARLAGLYPCATICEIMNDDGTTARLPDLVEFKKRHNMKMMSVASLIEYRLKHDTNLVKKIFEREITTTAGDFKLVGFRASDGRVHYALVRGVIDESPTLARVHSENAFADIFFDVSCKNGSKTFEKALEMIAEEGVGAGVYITQPDSGINVADASPLAPNVRDYGMGSQILRALGFKKIKLLTTNIGKHVIPEGFGLEIVEEIKIKD
ncbi:MAG: 3,4-dihydroxy-2-butanone-4-phosphate synthase [Opitutales bacterium]|nr:3,4-dihydroxy-2-butanone-4-phosphate synthase [Opitutales bacterium]